MFNLLRILFLVGISLIAIPSVAVGLLPIPSISGAKISAQMERDPIINWLIYRYTIANPSSSTGNIDKILINMRNDTGDYLYSDNFRLPWGISRPTFNEFIEDFRSLKPNIDKLIIPFGQDVPNGWFGGCNINGYASFWKNEDAPNTLSPGTTLGGFELFSYLAPTIREVILVPEWMLVVEDHDQVEEGIMEVAGQAEHDMRVRTLTLVPSAVQPGSFEHWNQLRDDLAKAIQLGWFPDSAFANVLTMQLASARAALNQGDMPLTQQRLKTLLTTIVNATATQRFDDGYGLLYFNLTRIIDNTTHRKDEEPNLKLTPTDAVLPLGATHTITAKVLDLANESSPMAGLRTYFSVDSGPNAGVAIPVSQTDANGMATGSYVGKQTGIDNLMVRVEYCGECSITATASVRWDGGPDLTVPFFIPPMLETGGGRTFYMSDVTENRGSTAAKPSVTKYFISSDPDFTPANTRLIGSGNVPALEPEAVSVTYQQKYILPDDLPIGVYWLAACADGDNSIVELDEQNNCSYAQLKGRKSAFVPIKSPSRPPECDKATASIATIWPPNHKLVKVGILGVTDPDGDPVTVTITGITQDEPVNGLGDGDTAPDGFGVGGNEAQVRAERSGLGNGRIYSIAFQADDGKGGSCTGNVTVGVPHDQGKGSVAVDDGQYFDSTK